MLNERKLTKAELNKREDIIKDMKKNKRALVKKYGKDAEQVMYGRATNIAKKQAESMNQDKLREMIKDSLQNPKKADLNKDGKLSDYEKKRGAAIEKSMEKKNLKEDWGSSDQSAMNQSIHRDLGNPTDFPGLTQIMSAAEDAVDFYWDDWDEYQTDREGLIMHAAQMYANKMFPEFMAGMRRMMEPIDERYANHPVQVQLRTKNAKTKKAKGEKVDEMDLNDPVLMKMRAARDKLAKMRAANASNDGNDKFFRASTAKLKKLAALKDKRAEIMRDMEQEAEMEGGPIADRYGDMLNKIDKAIAKLEGHGEWGPERDTDITAQEIAKRAAMFGLEEDLGIPQGSMAKINNIVKKPSDMAKVLLSFYDDVKEKEQVDFEKNQKMSIVLSKLRDLASSTEDEEVNEDLDLGHEDNEPHMLKGDLYRIGKYAMELYQMVEEFEGKGEVDFPHWWQAKIINAREAIESAKHYLDFETKEPEIDAMVGAIDQSGALDNVGVDQPVFEAAGKFVVRPCSNPDTPFAVWQTSKDGENDKRIEGFKTKEDAQKFADKKNSLNEGTWSVGSSSEIKKVMDMLDMAMDIKDSQALISMLEKSSKVMYNVVGDDIFHDDIDGAKREAAEGNMDRAQNRLSDAYSRAAYFQERQMDREGIKEEAVNTRHIEDHEYMAAKIQKAMNDLDRSSEDYESKLYRLQQARKANNKGDFKMAMKIMKPFLAETSVSSIAEKLAKQLKSK